MKALLVVMGLLFANVAAAEFQNVRVSTDGHVVAFRGDVVPATTDYIVRVAVNVDDDLTYEYLTRTAAPAELWHCDTGVNCEVVGTLEVAEFGADSFHVEIPLSITGTPPEMPWVVQRVRPDTAAEQVEQNVLGILTLDWVLPNLRGTWGRIKQLYR